MVALSAESKADIKAVYHELYCVATPITKEGVAVAEHFENYITGE